MRTVPCPTCSKPIQIGQRARRADYYCSDTCRLKCDLPGCDVPVMPLRTKCWTHRLIAD
jgi:hypothetical protein